MFKFLKRQVKSFKLNQSILFSDLEPDWSSREYSSIAKESYCSNVIAHRCISMIARNTASVPYKLFLNRNGEKKNLLKHPVLDILKRPNPFISCRELLEEFFSYNLISGESYILAVSNSIGTPVELHCLRPDMVKVHYDKSGNKLGYIYQAGEKKTLYKIDKYTGKSSVVALKNFHPLSKDKGISQIEAALNSIDQHNQASKWNQTLLQNSARPSGALVMSQGSMLTQKQYEQLKEQISDCFSGMNNSGKPILLEGGLEWKELGLTPKDMDFIESKNTAAREIALALGVPPQLLGIPGDNTYSNFQEARLAFWEDTIIPFADKACELLGNWFSILFDEELVLELNMELISALAAKRESVWARLENASFLTVNEKRAMLGFPPLEGEK